MILIGHTGNTVHTAQYTTANIRMHTLELFNTIIVLHALKPVFR